MAPQGKSDASRIQWNSTMDEHLIGVLKEEHLTGGRHPDGTWKHGALAHAAKEVFDQTGEEVSVEHVRAKRRYLQDKYKKARECKEKSGFGWNAATQLFTADSIAWKEFVTEHPKFKSFRSKQVPFYDDLDCIFGEEKVTGLRNFEGSESSAHVEPPLDSGQMSMVKEALHVSMAPTEIVCREEEQQRVLEFCRSCIQYEKPGSLYVCGCPGTGKTLSMDKVKHNILNWAKEAGFHEPSILSINCTSLGNTNEIFTKIIGAYQPRKKVHGVSALQHLQKMFSQKKQSSSEKMMIVIADELDYLITKDRSVLHDLFMLTSLPFSRFILIGIANALDLADRFLPKLQALNCKPAVVTFRAYSKDQILKILQQRLAVLPFDVFHPQALELCARKVAAASGDMRKALCVCRSAIEMLEAELKDNDNALNASQPENALLSHSKAPATLSKQDTNILRVDHMALALSRTFKSAVVDIIQSLPQHQQIVLCSMVKLFRGSKKDTTIVELSRSYNELCKSSVIPPAGFLEFSNMCRVLSDQSILKLGQSRDDRSRRVTLKIDEADVTFALQGIRFFRNCLQ